MVPILYEILHIRQGFVELYCDATPREPTGAPRLRIAGITPRSAAATRDAPPAATAGAGRRTAPPPGSRSIAAAAAHAAATGRGRGTGATRAPARAGGAARRPAPRASGTRPRTARS